MKAQLPLDEKRAVADVVVDNSGSLDDLDSEIDRAWTEVVRLCKQRRT